MSDVVPINVSAFNQPGRTEGAARVYARNSGTRAGDQQPGTVQREPDRVEVSDVATYVSKLKQLPPVRQELVDRVRDEIARGVYETPDKIDGAIAELGKDL